VSHGPNGGVADRLGEAKAAFRAGERGRMEDAPFRSRFVNHERSKLGTLEDSTRPFVASPCRAAGSVRVLPAAFHFGGGGRPIAPRTAAWPIASTGQGGVPGGGGASAIVRKSRQEMLNLTISDRMPLPLERRLTLDVSARVARMVGRASNKEGES
jgi:hypothetical protein